MPVCARHRPELRKAKATGRNQLTGNLCAAAGDPDTRDYRGKLSEHRDVQIVSKPPETKIGLCLQAHRAGRPELFRFRETVHQQALRTLATPIGVQVLNALSIISL